MKNILLAAIAVAALTATAAVAEVKVAIFDAQETINATNAAKRAVQTLTSKRDAAQAKINALEKPLIDKQDKLREQQAVMTADKLKAAQTEFAKDLAKFRADAQAIQADLDKENLKIRKQIADAVRTVVEEIAKEKGYDVILPKGMTFYTSPAIPNISADALARANKVLDK